MASIQFSDRFMLICFMLSVCIVYILIFSLCTYTYAEKQLTHKQNVARGYYYDSDLYTTAHLTYDGRENDNQCLDLTPNVPDISTYNKQCYDIPNNETTVTKCCTSVCNIHCATRYTDEVLIATTKYSCNIDKHTLRMCRNDGFPVDMISTMRPDRVINACFPGRFISDLNLYKLTTCFNRRSEYPLLYLHHPELQEFQGCAMIIPCWTTDIDCIYRVNATERLE